MLYLVETLRSAGTTDSLVRGYLSGWKVCYMCWAATDHTCDKINPSVPPYQLSSVSSILDPLDPTQLPLFVIGILYWPGGESFLTSLLALDDSSIKIPTWPRQIIWNLASSWRTPSPRPQTSNLHSRFTFYFLLSSNTHVCVFTAHFLSLE